jgi:2'-5' RNA ligase
MTEPVRRLFFALWPEAPVRTALDSAAQAITGKRIRRIPAHNLHLTLAFAGTVPASVQSCLEAQADRLRLPGFELCIDTVGHFPRPRIQWLGPSRIPPALRELAGALHRVLTQCGLEPDARAFQAHISIARKVSRALPVRPFGPVHWSIGSFWLVESVTAATGVRYFPLRAWTLERQTPPVG